MQTQNYETLIYETHQRVAVITLNRPGKLNAWTQQMASEQLHAIGCANEDDGIGAIIMTGAGRAFCAGADIGVAFKQPLDSHDDKQQADNQQQENRIAQTWVSTVRSSKPLIAAVNGPALGVGATMVLSFDVILASENASFGMLFVKMGMVPELASSHFLVQRVGFGKASELCLTGRSITGADAVAIGLADHLTSPEQLLPRAREIATEIAANPGPQLRMVKALLTAHGSATDLASVVEREGKLLQEARETAEHREAVNAFLEKRSPDFHGLT
jgi:enoyl-CoA hydratase/carnithine racemase